jgi:hypothetical protein
MIKIKIEKSCAHPAHLILVNGKPVPLDVIRIARALNIAKERILAVKTIRLATNLGLLESDILNEAIIDSIAGVCPKYELVNIDLADFK